MTFFTRQASNRYVSNRYLYSLVFITLAASLHACGFQLRGSINLSTNISPIYLEQNSVFKLAREIRTLLATNKIDVVDSVKNSKAQLILLNEAKSRRVLSVDGSGRAREYLLQYDVNFVITTSQQTALAAEAIAANSPPGAQRAVEEKTLSQDSISVSRSLVFDPDAVLAVTNEAEILYNDMRRDAARRILLKLEALSNKQNKAADTAVTE